MSIFPIIIFAGNWDEADIFAHEQGLSPKQWVYPYGRDLHGLMNPFVFLVGTYFNHPSYTPIMQALIPARPHFFNSSGELLT